MHDNRWWIWIAVTIVLLIYRGLRARFSGAKNANGGMARLNAAAERILKERGASVSNPIPRTKPLGTKPLGTKPMGTKPTGTKPMGAKPARVHSTGSKPKTQMPLPKTSTPAVVRRGSLLSAGREPVIQRRR
jgi:hypothetical protein